MEKLNEIEIENLIYNIPDVSEDSCSDETDDELFLKTMHVPVRNIFYYFYVIKLIENMIQYDDVPDPVDRLNTNNQLDDVDDVFTLPTYYRENTTPPVELADNFTTELFSEYIFENIELENTSEVTVNSQSTSTISSNTSTSKNFPKKQTRKNTFFQTRTSHTKKKNFKT